MQEIYRSFALNYTRILREFVFSSGDPPQLRHDRKTIKSFKKMLEDYDANQVLSILWRESIYVSEYDLAFDGYSKLLTNNLLTTYCLAVHMAVTKNDVAATNSRIRLIVAAGAAFGLIGRTKLTATRTYIFGTQLLHEFMVRLGFENAKSCAEILWQDPEAQVSLESFISLPFGTHRAIVQA